MSNFPTGFFFGSVVTAIVIACISDTIFAGQPPDPKVTEKKHKGKAQENNNQQQRKG